MLCVAGGAERLSDLLARHRRRRRLPHHPTPRVAQVGVEVDGPQHFLAGAKHPSGATLLKRRLLNHQGWLVLPVPHWEFEEAPNKHAYLMSALAGLVDVHGRRVPVPSRPQAHANGRRSELCRLPM